MADYFQEPLFNAIVKGDDAAVTRLLGLGALINNPDSNGLTALHWASATPESELIVPLLLGT